MDNKPCSQCRRQLPGRAFNVNRARGDGLDAMCRTCRSEWKIGKPGGRKNLPPLALEPAVAGYVAGMLDGEGSILIKPMARQLVSICYVTNTHRGAMDWLASTLGFGNVVVSHRPIGRRICYRWVASGRNVRRLLLAVTPLLIIKRRHADLLLAFYGQRQAYKERLPGALRPDTLQEPLLGLYQELRVLNRRGPHLS